MFNFGVMLFNLKEFEHFFSESVLKKGLTLFERNKVQLLPTKKEEGKLFQVGKAQVHLHRRGERVLSYTCSCSASYLCEHMAALAFFLQRDAFQTKSSKKRKSGRSETGAANNFKNAIQNSTNKELKSFFRLQQPDPGVVKKLFRDPGAGELELYCLFWKAVFQPYLNAGVLGNERINQLTSELTVQCEKHLESAGAKARRLPFALSLFLELNAVFNLRITGSDLKLKEIRQQTQEDLSRYFLSELNENSIFFWKRALLVLLGEGTGFAPAATLFLLPRVLQLTKSRHFFSELTARLEQKKYRRNYSEPFDFLIMAKWMLYIQRKKVLHEAYPASYSMKELEYSLALSELLFCGGKKEKSVLVLKQVYDSWSPSIKQRQSSFRDYLMERAKEIQATDLEMYALQESLVYDLYLQPEKLNRFLKLISFKNRHDYVTDLVQRVRREAVPLWQEKLKTLLFETGRYDELIQELKKQDNDFLLLHKVMNLKWPDYEKFELDIYLRHLMQAFNNRRVFHRPEDLFSFAMTYITKLPPTERLYIRDYILSKLGGKSIIHQFVSTLFESA